MQFTPIYAAVLGLIYVALSASVIRTRRRLRISLGDRDDPQMRRVVRVHSNFAEYVPIALLLVFFLEVGGAANWLIHLLGCALVAGRVLHACGLDRPDGKLTFRVAGMMLTFTTIVGAAIGILVQRIF